LGFSISTLVDSVAESAHKCGIATLAEEYPAEESSFKTRERDIPVNVFPVSFLVILVKDLRNAGTEMVQQARAGLRSFSYLQPRALNES
jgi:hypothetical protein